jgi:hypothetical protein
MIMTEVFLVNYTHDASVEWACHHMTHSLAVASAKAQELRDMGYRVNVQSVLIDEDGRIQL